MTGGKQIRRQNLRTDRPVMRLVNSRGAERPLPYGMRSGHARTGPGKREKASAGGQRLVFMLLVLAVGVLLGRAVLLGGLTPFVLAVFAASLYMRKGAAVWMAAGLTLGSFSAQAAGVNPYLTVAMIGAYRLLMYVLERVERVDIHVAPFLVFAVDVGFRIGFTLPLATFTWYSALLAAADGFLAFLLTVMFLQMPPLLSSLRPQKPLRWDEVLGLAILLASVLSGLRGVHIAGMSLEGTLARLVVLVFAYLGGAGLGGAVGAVTGVIMSLGALAYAPIIGMLAFGGVLAGVLRDSGRLATAGGFLVGTVSLSLYDQSAVSVIHGAEAALVSVALFFIIPKSTYSHLARYVPGTPEFIQNRQEHARRIKELLTARIHEVARVFSQLSSSFSDVADHPAEETAWTTQAIDLTIDELCSQCRKVDRCFGTDAAGTRAAMQKTLAVIRDDPDVSAQDVPREMYSRCIKLDQLVPALKRSAESFRRAALIHRQLTESRGLVAAQLSGVAAIMQDLADQLQRENGASRKQEVQIVDALGQLGLEVQGIDIVSLEEGKVEIEVLQVHPNGHDECAKLIAPLLSDVLGETIAVQRTDLSQDGSYQKVTLTSARLFDVVAGFASAAKDGALQSGDSFSVLDIGNGRYAITVSDGMGNGLRASRESTAAVRMVSQLLKAGFDESVAVRTVNSALLLRSKEEMYATLDLAIVDLYTLQTEFLKVGSVATYVKRGRSVMAIEGDSVPIGILREIDVQTKRVALCENDLLVFMSDGILEAVSQMREPQDWVRRQLERMDGNDPQVIADLLLEFAVRVGGGAIRDDMTVVCARMERHKPDWATIKLSNVPVIRHARRAPTEVQAKRLVQV